MSSNVQTQINDLNAAVQALDSSLTQITGNTMSNYNQLSRIVSQQANIYNTLYYGDGDVSTRNLSVSANALITGNLVISNGNIGIGTVNPLAKLDISGNARITGNVMIGSGNLFMNHFGNLGLGTTNPLSTLDISGNARITGNVNVGTQLQIGNSNTIKDIRTGIVAGGASTGSVTFSPAMSSIPVIATTIQSSFTTQLFSINIFPVSTTGFSYSKTYLPTNGGAGGQAVGESFWYIAIST